MANPVFTPPCSHPKAVCSSVLSRTQHWLDIDNRRAVDGFDRPNQQPVSIDLSHAYTMQADGIRPIGRARCKDARQRILLVSAGMHLQHLAPRLVKPCEHDDLIADGKTFQCRRRKLVHLQPSFWRTFPSLAWSILAILQLRMDDAHGAKRWNLRGRLALGLRLWASVGHRDSTSANALLGAAGNAVSRCEQE